MFPLNVFVSDALYNQHTRCEQQLFTTIRGVKMQPQKRRFPTMLFKSRTCEVRIERQRWSLSSQEGFDVVLFRLNFCLKSLPSLQKKKYSKINYNLTSLTFEGEWNPYSNRFLIRQALEGIENVSLDKCLTNFSSEKGTSFNL